MSNRVNATRFVISSYVDTVIWFDSLNPYYFMQLHERFVYSFDKNGNPFFWAIMTFKYLKETTIFIENSETILYKNRFNLCFSNNSNVSDLKTYYSMGLFDSYGKEILLTKTRYIHCSY